MKWDFRSGGMIFTAIVCVNMHCVFTVTEKIDWLRIVAAAYIQSSLVLRALSISPRIRH